MSNVDQAEIQKFEALAHRWWDPEGDFKPLHDINPLRLGYIDARASLAGKRVLDVGCGEQLYRDEIERLIGEGREINLVTAIGPVPMMKAVSDLTRTFEVPTLVSLNPIMIDGTGMCGVCRVTVGGTTRFACVHGPDFDGHEVDWAELLQRHKTYMREEVIP